MRTTSPDPRILFLLVLLPSTESRVRHINEAADKPGIGIPNLATIEIVRLGLEKDSLI